MELTDNDFTISDIVTHFSSSHPYFHHHREVDHPFMSCILPTPEAHLSTSTYNNPFTTLTVSAELCHKKLEKSDGRKRKRREHDAGAVQALNLNSSTSDSVHVRVKRGQATDSHSLAERVRRKKINEKFQSLHDIVPGCHKTMGMAVMLDVVIKYIQSLQNQIEFLSMKLLAASLCNNLNASDMDTVGTMQGPAHGAEVQEMERLVAQGYSGFNSTFFSQESLQNQ